MQHEQEQGQGAHAKHVNELEAPLSVHALRRHGHVNPPPPPPAFRSLLHSFETTLAVS